LLIKQNDYRRRKSDPKACTFSHAIPSAEKGYAMRGTRTMATSPCFLALLALSLLALSLLASACIVLIHWFQSHVVFPLSCPTSFCVLVLIARGRPSDVLASACPNAVHGPVERRDTGPARDQERAIQYDVHTYAYRSAVAPFCPAPRPRRPRLISAGWRIQSRVGALTPCDLSGTVTVRD
jgi:hypothetical protein